MMDALLNSWQIQALIAATGIVIFFISQLLSDSLWGGIPGVVGVVFSFIGILLLIQAGYVGGGITGLAFFLLVTIFNMGIKFNPANLKGEGQYSKLVGKEGISLSNLNPKGKIEIDGQKLDVTTEGIFISEGSKVRVLRTKGSVVIVEPC